MECIRPRADLDQLTLKGIDVPLSLLSELVGAAVLLGAWYLGVRRLPESHWLRRVLFNRHRPLESASRLGLYLVLLVFAALTIFYA